MNQGKPAAFRFKDYHIKKFDFDSTFEDKETPLDIGFELNGMFNIKSQSYTQQLVCLGKVNNHNLFRIEMDSVFEFSDLKSFEDIPAYFYGNSLGIVYPYIRAFISTLTLQANCGDIVVLSLLNLTDLAQVLKENTEVRD